MNKNELTGLLKHIEESPDRTSISEVLKLEDPGLLKQLYEYAYKIKLKHVGNRVFFRGIIEFSNICTKDCYYFGSRKRN